MPPIVVSQTARTSCLGAMRFWSNESEVYAAMRSE